MQTGWFVGPEGSRNFWDGTENGLAKDVAAEVMREGISFVRAAQRAWS